MHLRNQEHYKKIMSTTDKLIKDLCMMHLWPKGIRGSAEDIVSLEHII